MNRETALLFAPAVSISVPGVVTPNVDVPPDPVTVIDTGELRVDAEWLSVTFSTAL